MATNILQTWGRNGERTEKKAHPPSSWKKGEEMMGEMQLSWQPWWAAASFFFFFLVVKEAKSLAMSSGKVRVSQGGYGGHTQHYWFPTLPATHLLPTCPNSLLPMGLQQPPGFPVQHQLPELAQTRPWVSDPINLSSSIVPFPPFFQSFPSITVFPIGYLFASVGQSIGASILGLATLYQTYLQQGNIRGILLERLRKLIFFF